MPKNRKKRRMDGDQLATPEAAPMPLGSPRPRRGREASLLDPAPEVIPAAALNPASAPAASSTKSGPGTSSDPDAWSAEMDRECSMRTEKLRTAQAKLKSASDEDVIGALKDIRDCFTPANPRFNEVLPSAELVDFDRLLSLLRSPKALIKRHVIEDSPSLCGFSAR